MSLRDYEKKRDFARTREPSPRARGAAGRRSRQPIFVVQHHFASREHYDFRLESEGVLKSWAVPKGPSDDPSVKRLAVQVEDHPLEYAKFAGRIPKGSYGAGVVKIWDHGTWTPEEDPARALREGKLAFELNGKKLKGRWALVRMRPSQRYKGENNWLLFKHDGARAEAVDGQEPRAARAPAMPARARAAKPSNGARPAFVPPQLAFLAESAPAGPGWVHELKLDGYRIELIVEAGKARLITRSGADWTERFPEIAAAALELPGRSLVLDGEVVALKARTSSFSALQAALKDGRTSKLEYHAFDLLHFDGRDLRGQPLSVRREALERLLGKPARGARIQLSRRLSGKDPLGVACKRGVEGVVSKRDDAPYESRRSRNWIKSKCGRRQEFVVVGFSEPRGRRGGFGALLLGVHDEARGLRYAGKVGAGFSHGTLRELRARLDALERQSSPLSAPPAERPTGVLHWVRPVLVAEVSFTEWTTEGLLRHPVFHGLREDKPAKAVRREEPQAAGRAALPASSAVVAGVTITHPERVVYPKLAVTKLELAQYHELVAPLMLPHVAERPLSLLRCPEGQGGTCFYQKHWNESSPGIETIDVREENGAARSYAVVRRAADVVRLIQYGVMELHPWGSRADDVDAPDRITFDLDPHEDVPWKRVVEGAFAVRELLAELGFESWLKTSGGKGLHVVLPIERRVTWSAVSAFARAVAERVARAHPERYVVVAAKAARKGRIFIDHLRNTRGATAIAPWSTRARDSASVSLPIRWEEAARTRSGDAFTLETVRRLAGGQYEDPWADLPRAKNRITLDTGRKLLER